MAIEYGRVVGKLLREYPDAPHADGSPDLVPFSGTVQFTRHPLFRYVYDSTGTDAIVRIEDRTVGLDPDGVLVDDPDSGEVGVVLAAGPWIVSFDLAEGELGEFTITVTAGQTLDLLDAIPVNPASLTPTTQGPPGASAYDTWLAQGNSGSEGDFLLTLVGPTGPTGPAAPDATASVKGIVTLAGKLGGTADNPDVPELGLKLNRQLTRKTVSTDYVVAAGDEVNTVLHLNSSSDMLVTLPTDANADVPLDTPIRWRHYGTGQVQFDPQVGASLITAGGITVTAGRGSEGYITKVAADTWVVSGQLAIPGVIDPGEGSAWVPAQAWDPAVTWVP